MIVEIKAKFSCDDCGTEFLTPLDPAYQPPAGWSIFDVAEDSIRAGLHYEDGTDDSPIGSGSVSASSRQYCARCTKKRDAPRSDAPHICTAADPFSEQRRAEHPDAKLVSSGEYRDLYHCPHCRLTFAVELAE